MNLPPNGSGGGLTKPELLLLPANSFFAAFTVLLALLLDLLPWGQAAAVPQWTALVLSFWGVQQPRMIGFSWAFALGLLLDVHAGAVLGEQALGLLVISYGAVALHRRLPAFGLLGQMLHLIALLLIAQACRVLLRLAMGEEFPGWWIFLSPMSTGLLWP
ncbi:MAG: rod shape-determining protein MreD, partial [Betaproteobacteria bacterium]|nr:rod shape-determining protein MreD [Betaproteobacteria bacterium]